MAEMLKKQGMTPEEERLDSAPIPKLLMAYAVPSIVSMVINAVYNIVDQIFIGNIVGYLGNGATNVVFPITMAGMAISMLFGNGGGAMFSLSLGEKNYEQARKGIGSATVAIFIVATLLAIFSSIFLEPICRLFGGTDEIIPYALEYGHIIMIGVPFVSVIIVLSAFIRGDGSPKRAMAAMMCGAILNIILDPIFMIVFDMGVKGAAIATVISQLTGLFITVPYVRKFKTVKLTKKDFIPDFKVLGKICTLGLSSFVSQIAMLFLVGLLNNSFVKYGAMSKYGAEIPLTAMGITSKLSQIVTAFAMGMNMGSQPIIGYNYGAGNIKRVKKTFTIALSCCLTMMVIGTVLFEVFTKQIIGLFGSESELYNEFAVKNLRIFMVALLANGFTASATIFFQAIGKPIQSTIISSLRQIVLLIPSIVIIPLFFGLEGLMWSTPVADVAAFFVALTFFIFQWRKLEKVN